MSQILKEINSFRKNPFSFEKTFQISSKALMKSKKPNEGNAINAFLQKISSIEKLSDLSLSNGLSLAAAFTLEKTDRLGKIKFSGDLTGFLCQFCEKVDNPFEIIIENELDSSVASIVSKSNKNNDFIGCLISKSVNNIGIAANENFIVVYVSDGITEKEIIDYAEDKPLKEAFDLFDVYSTGLLDEKSLKDAFKALGLDKENYSVYSAIIRFNGNNKVKKQGGVDFETFRETIKELIGDVHSKEGIRKVFELFIDDDKYDSITSDSIKRVSNELGEDLTNKEVIDIMKRICENGAEIGFDEFYKIMLNYEEFHPSE